MARTKTAAKTLRVEIFIAMLDPDCPTNDYRRLSATREPAGVISFPTPASTVEQTRPRNRSPLSPQIETPRAAPE